MKINFNNTKTAFESKSDNDLKRAYLLFKTVASPKIVKMGEFFVNLALKLHLPFAWAIKPTIYKHFVGGENIQECDTPIHNLENFGVDAILDYSVEGKEDESDIQHAMEETLRSIENAGKNKSIPFCVFKPTAMCQSIVLEKVSAGAELSELEKTQANKFKERVETLCQKAFDLDIPILIDAEDSWYQKFIDDEVNKNMAKFNKKRAIVFNTFQMYRWDRLDYLEKSYQMAVEGNYFLGAKFVRGAYMEKERERALQMGYPSPIQPNKASTDRDYNLALKFCIERIDRISIFNGTHNEESCQYLIDLMDEHGISKDDKRIFTAQLYGMSDHISFNMSKIGFNIAKYLPYGPVKHVTPYLLRRAEENTSAAGQSGRELSLILQEKERRKKETNK